MKFNPLAPLILAIATMACAPGNGRQVDQSNQQAIADGMNWHDAKRATDSAVLEAMNPPDGKANYPKAIAVFEASGRPKSVIDLEVGNTILGAYREAGKVIMPTQSVDEGIERLERAALGDGEGAENAPGALARWFTRGSGKALIANPRLAACWQMVDAHKSAPADCIAARKNQAN